ncbi:hypothetical protein PRIPAC_76545 [Pristionchus pacificus]|uniref:Uncharacterized protein n=1 Tax=Pristionchus pacificus TaxID=54126 RepID=A0A2A6C6S2_PRIPA|nr:hypothetical protein PRIPAC_76545 [Pristionchus pacificus]|eukprot:PDM73874.1 hypothetical protein PRIPAC_41230 [Pristionchus pacificus]
MNTNLLIIASLIAISAAQMTFSDGWEKRSGSSRPYHYAHQKVARSGAHVFHEMDKIAEAAGAKDDEPSKNLIPITNCMEEYMAGVRALQAAMMELYTRYQTCEFAKVNPLLHGSHGKTSPARF